MTSIIASQYLKADQLNKVLASPFPRLLRQVRPPPVAERRPLAGAERRQGGGQVGQLAKLPNQQEQEQDQEEQLSLAGGKV